MAIDYKKELEAAARNMILEHNLEKLIRRIVQTIVRKVKVKHAGILLYDKEKKIYILTVSGGKTGLKIPKGLVRLDADSPLVKFFTMKNQNLASSDYGILVSNKMDHSIWKYSLIKSDNNHNKLIEKVKEQLSMFETAACIPSYFQDSLLGILLLGEKTSGEDFRQEELDFFAALASDVAMAIRNASLFEDLQRELKINRDLFINITFTLAEAIEAKDHYTKGHTERVTRYALLIAQKLQAKHKSLKIDDAFMGNLHVASLLHDIGKIAVPEGILNKPGRLTEEEFARIKEHPERGVKILAHIKELKDAIPGVKYHHERFDGKGYPEGLKGDRIPLIAAIISVADVYDAMTSDRPYRSAIPRDVVIEEIKKGSGTQFHPLVVEALLELYNTGKI
jgi:HD-GYP domain-containing protein (c-di-GMP phosphodiesterase class II)